MQTQVIASKKEYKIVGHNVTKKDAAEKATGKILYSSDLNFPDLLIGRILHSSHPHARILSIDTSKAEALPGVKAVVTHADLPSVRIGRRVRDRYVLARDKVRFIGEPVAAVAAIDEETADEALSLIQVEYQELPAVLDVSTAMSPTAPLVHEDLIHYKSADPNFKPQGNIVDQAKLVRGDVEKAWSQCHLIHEDDYHTPVVYHGFTQPHETTAAVDSSGRITVWVSNKAPFIVRQMLATALGISMSRIRIAPIAMGGDFGGKGTAQTEPICVLLALKSRHPVRLCLSREEELTSTYLKEATTSHLKIGVNRNGKLVAFQASITYDAGAYTDFIGNMVAACIELHGPYHIPNVDIAAFRVYTNKTPTGHMRAPTIPQPCFAMESHMDMVARKLGIDPIEFRLQNAHEDGDTDASGARLINPGIKETLRRTQAYLKREKGIKKPNEGWGIACDEHPGVTIDSHGTEKMPRHAQASAWVKINEDGSVILFTGAKEQGGGQITIAAQIVAETLGISYDNVAVLSGDTDTTPWDQGTGASDTTFRMGKNVLLAAEDARNQLIELAAQKMAISPSKIELQGGRVYAMDDPAKGMTLAEIAALGPQMLGSPILGTGAGLRKAKFAGALPGERWHDGVQHGTHAVKVRVDPDTGKVQVLKYFACQDVGFAINPQNVEAQIEGGVVFGLGFALSEEVIIQDSKTLNPNLTDYRLPVATDVPKIESEIVQIPSMSGPLGAKGLGEAINNGAAPAIANAVCDAIGRRITRLPLTCERVYQALQEKESSI